jgi:hypothetical protein
LELIELHVNDAIERYVAIAQPYFALGIGSDSYYKMKELATQRIFKDSEKYLAYAYEYTNKALRIADDLCERMEALSPEEFEAWKVYRQALRDLPANTIDPENPPWPEPFKLEITNKTSTKTQLQAEKEKTQQLEVRLSLLESTLASLIS